MVPTGIEVLWAILTPKIIPPKAKVSRICIACVYISPKSKLKTETIEHIIQGIHFVRSAYDSVSQVVTGDFNRVPIDDILDSFGSLQNIQTKPTRKGQILDLLITDLHTSYLPTTIIPALHVDFDKKGVKSDHDIIVFPPAQDGINLINRPKKTIKTRPLPAHLIPQCGEFFATRTWEEVFNATSANEKVEAFHKILREALESFFPEKLVKLSNFDKKWFTPQLKGLHRRKQREFSRNRYSEKYKILMKNFRKMKKSSKRNHYSCVTEKLKKSNPHKFYSLVKEICNPYQHNDVENCQIEELEGKSPLESSEIIAEHFAKVSQSYQPIDLSQLPSYLPSPKPPQVSEMDVYEK